MVKPLLLGGALIFLMAFVMACGGAADPEPTAAPAATATTAPPTEAPTAAPTPTEAAMEEDEGDAMSDADAALVAVADELAGGPGSIYIGDGDFSRMVGPSPGGVEEALGDGTGMVPLEFLEKNRHIFETDYYRSLIEKANLTNPTQMTSVGEKYEIQYACINRALLPCKLQIVYFTENVRERTNGQVDFEVSSYPELGLAGSDMLELVQSGTIEFAQIQPAYVGGTWPLIDIIYVWGLWQDFKSEHEANTGLLPALDAGVERRNPGRQADLPHLVRRERPVLLLQPRSGAGGIRWPQDPQPRHDDDRCHQRPGRRGPVHGIRRGLHRTGARHSGRWRYRRPRRPRPRGGTR